MTNPDGFQLSRVYAEGWKAAHLRPASPTRMANPYTREPERARWNDGFSDARKQDQSA